MIKRHEVGDFQDLHLLSKKIISAVQDPKSVNPAPKITVEHPPQPMRDSIALTKGLEVKQSED